MQENEVSQEEIWRKKLTEKELGAERTQTTDVSNKISAPFVQLIISWVM